MSIPECIDIDGRTISLIVRFRRKARNLRLRLNHRNQVVVSVPSYFSARDVLSFIDRQHLWLKKQVACIPEAASMSDWLREHPFLSTDGKRFYVNVKPVDSLRANYEFEGNGQEIVFCVPRSSKDLDVTLLKLVRVFADDALAGRLNHHARRLNLKFAGLTVRDQLTRWGSCSGKRRISLNWRLVLVAPELQDYVILHELAHLTEMNHSKRFWDLLDSYDPLRPEHESAVKKVTGTVMRVGRR